MKGLALMMLADVEEVILPLFEAELLVVSELEAVSLSLVVMEALPLMLLDREDV